MKKIRLSFPYDWPLFRQTKGNLGEWGQYKFYLEDSEIEYDAWVVFNSLDSETEVTRCPKDRVILITPEPYSIQLYPQKFIEQFSHVITNQNQLKHSNKIIFHTGTPWFVNKNFDELLNFKSNFLKKDKKMSIITSNKLITEGHKKRFDFAMNLKKHFKDQIDLFGRGVNSFEDKWNVLEPYQFNICIENCSQDDYFTEKINDCFLAFTYPIYYGCTNLENYYDSQSFKKIDINDFKQSVEVIDKMLNDDIFYYNHLNALKLSRETYLNNYNIFPLISNFLDRIGNTKEKMQSTKIKKRFLDFNTIGEKIIYKFTKK